MNNKDCGKGGKISLSKVVKASLPVLAAIAGGAFASTRNNSASRSSSRRNAPIASVVVLEGAVPTLATAASLDKIAVETVARPKRSAFGVFVNENTQTLTTVDVEVNHRALSFLKANGFLGGDHGLKQAGISGDTLNDGRKVFAHTITAMEPFFSITTCDGSPYTFFQWNPAGPSCTAVGAGLVSATNLPACQLIHDNCNAPAHSVNPEINLQGNGVSIADGDLTPSVGDHTDFGSHVAGGANLVRTFTIQNTGTGSLDLTGSPNVSISGSSDFSITAQPSSDPLGASSSTTFQVTLDPTTGGVQSADISITSDDANEATYNFRIQATISSQNTDGGLTASATVTEPIGLDTTKDTIGEAVDVFDFILSDGGGGDGLTMDVSQVVLNVSGSASVTVRNQITWRLNGNDATNVVGTYNAGTITFSSLSISIADAGSETYTVNAYYNNTSGLIEDSTIILSVDGDTDLTVSGAGTQMAATSAVNNSTGTTIDVTATAVAFTTQPSGSTSGSVLSTQPVVSAVDAAGNIDVDFTETVTLSEASAGSLSGASIAAVSGVATFTNVNYTATADQQSFVLTANDQNGIGADLPTVDANAVTSDVVATKLIFDTQPLPTAIISGQATAFTTVPVLSAVDANNVVDTGYGTGIVMSLTDPNDGTLDGSVVSMSGTGDVDGDGSTVTLTPASGAVSYTGLSLTYNAGGLVDDIALKATSGALTSVTSNSMTASTPPTVSDGNISISGASGSGGAYIIGDTLTATWNNTGGGDNNSGVSSVTVDFSAFGGGASVSASNSSETWTATYTLVAGAIDTTNLNISVSATSAGGSATTADTSNATLDNIAPIVTDGNISISGASGSGGAYIVGDTITATWNNTAGGDNNSDISSASVNFTAFGGGAAVSASNSSGTWTATYTLVAGAIDGNNLNVSLTATDDAGNATTTADSSNATVDNTAPVVTDGNISVSGASGSGGAYIVGDTITATWNNTAGGDNNSDISTTTVDFSAFGGGAAVSASNSSGTWTATYTIVAGAVDTSNLNVSVSATDDAGNATTTADSSNATVDNTAPVVSDGNISISGASGSGGAFVVGDTITATWNNTAGGDNNSDISSASVNFTAFGGGAAVSASNSSGTWTATYTLVAGAIDGNNLNVSLTATDDAGNATTTADTSNATVDNTAPVVTDGNISISGASGSGGAFVAGDTITATWNNTAGGDNNSDISSVTADFTAFGGGAAVSASNSSGTWTASYTLLAGAIDATNLNVSLTATDDAGLSTTTADSTNATVDNSAPTVSDGNISISGASGTGGAFVVGDTITATWNNTAGGDNNSDISSASVNFTAFGGGAAVSASNSSGTWTATYTLVAGAIDGSNLNVSVTATDDAGNATTTADTSNATVDNTAPVVTDGNISISGASGSGGAFVAGDTITATWNNTAGGDNNSDISSVTADFTAFGGGAAVSASNSSGTWTASYTLLAGAIDGSNINVSVTATDDANNSTTTADSSNATVDNAAPTLTDGNISISGASGTGGAFVTGDTITATWNNTAGGDNNSDISTTTVDFSAFGGGAAVSASNSSGTWTATYTLVAGAIDGSNLNVSVTATDNAGNSTTTADSSNATVDNLAATVSDANISLAGASGNGGVYILGDTLTATWNNGAGGDNNSDITAVTVDFSAFGGGTAVTASNSSDTWTATYTLTAGSISGSNLNIAVTATDNGGNVTTTADSSNAVVDVDAPSVSSVSGATADGAYKAGDVIDLRVSFDEAVTVTGSPQITLETGTVDRVVAFSSGSPGTSISFLYTVQAGDTSADLDYLSTTALALNGGTIKDAAGNAASLSFAAPAAANSLGANQAYVIDTAAPSLNSSAPANGANNVINSADIVLTFSENIFAGSGNVTLFDAADDSVVEAVASSSLSISAALVTFNASSNFTPAGSYYLQVDSGAFTDEAGNDYAGFADKTTLSFTVINNLPVVVDDSVSVDEDNAVAIDVLGNDTDSDSSLNAASTALVSGPSNGATSINTGNGVITYTPTANFNGSDSFTYSVQDAFGGQGNTATVTITVNAVNDAPVATADLASTPEDNAVNIDVAANDSDIDLGDSVDTASIVIVSAPSDGSAVVSAGEVIYTPDLNFNGSDSFTYTINDQSGTSSNVATVVINVTGVNDLPVANDDSGAVDEDSSIDIDILGNDTDADGSLDASTVLIMSDVSKGSTSVDAITGVVTYTPTADYNGADSFTYIVRDDTSGTSNLATVTLTVNSVNDAPVATADTASLQEDTPHAINVLGNDTDKDGSVDASSVEIVTAASSGSTSVNSATGVITYTPSADFNGSDSFTYRVQDNDGIWSNAAAVTITVISVNDPPLANDDSASTDEDVDVVIDLLSNDSDLDGSLDASSLSLGTPSTGTLVDNGDGTVTYSPGADYVGADSFTYSVMDNSGDASNSATVSITMNAVDDPPSISGSPASTVVEDSSYSFTPTANDVDSGSLSFSVINAPSWASLDGATGQLSGSPANADVGSYSGIVISVSDATTQVDLPAFTIEVSNSNDAPLITGIPVTSVSQGGSYAFTPTASDIDVGDELSFSVVNLPSWAVFAADTGTISGVPSNSAVGTYNGITVSVSDGTDSTSLTAFSITVVNVNDAPTAVDDSYSLNEGGSLTVSAVDGVAANDVDIDGDPRTVTLTTGPANAQNFILNADGSFSYSHDGSETSSDSFSYTTSDGSLTSAASTVNLAIAPVNDAPVFTSAPPVIAVAQGERFDYYINITDPDSVTQVSLQQAPDWLSLNGSTLSGRAPVDATGTSSVILRVTDGEYTVDQSFDLAMLSRELPVVSIVPTWKTLPARVGEVVTLKLSLQQSFGQPVSLGRLTVRLKGLNSDSASMDNCSRSGQVFSCDTALSTASPVVFKMNVAPSAVGSLVAELRFVDVQSNTQLAANITDVTVSTQPVSQGNGVFDLANATSIASIDVLSDDDKELVAGTSLGDTVKLLDYDFANLNQGTANQVEVIAEIDNRGHTVQVLVADVDADTLNDILVVNSSGAASAVYYDRGANFEFEAGSQTLPNAKAGILRDLDDDGFPELLLTNGGFNIYLYHNRDGVLSEAPYIFKVPASVVHFALLKRALGESPLAGSLVIASGDTMQIIRFALATANLTKPGEGASGTDPRQFAVTSSGVLAIPGITAIRLVDVNADGAEEILLSSAHQSASSDYSGITVVAVGDGSNPQPAASFGDASAGKVEVADFNGDGKVDLLVGNDNGTYQFYIGDGSLTTWSLKQEVIFEDSPLTLAEDFNNDGLADVLVYRDDQEKVELYTTSVEGEVGVGTDLQLQTTVAASSSSTYRVSFLARVDNVGDEPAQSAFLTVDLVSGLSPVALPDNCSADDNQIICTLGDLAVGDVAALSFELQGDGNIGTLSVASRVHSAAADSDGSDNAATASLEGLFATTRVRVKGGGRSGGAVNIYWLLPLLGLARLPRRRKKSPFPARGICKILRMSSLAVVLSLLSFNSHGQTNTTTDPSPWANAYVELDLGSSKSDWNRGAFVRDLDAITQEAKLSGYHANRSALSILGGYRLKPWLAVEGGYRDSSKVDLQLDVVSSDVAALKNLLRTQYPISGAGPYLGAVFSCPFYVDGEVFLKAGLWAWQGDYTLDINDQSERFHQSGTDLVVGLGANYFVSDNIAIGLLADYLSLDGQQQITWGATVKYRLGQ